MSQTNAVEELRAELCRKDFGEYCKWVHGRELYRHQVGWVEEMQREKARTLIVAPPETFKSSTIRMLLEWWIRNDRDITILLIMNTSTQAQMQVMSIAETLTENPRYKCVFPWVVPNPKRGWSHEMLFIKRANESMPDPTLYGTGVDGPYQGAHVKVLVCDDPTDQSDVQSSAIMEQQRKRLRGVLIDRLTEGGSFLSILTRWGEGDLVRDFKEMGFQVIENPIEGRYTWGRLLCPEVFGDDRLQEIRQVKGGQLYQLTYMCNPAAAEGAMLKREWWRVYSEAPKMEKVIHSWDLSTGKSELGDYSAYQSWGVSEEGFYLLDAGRWRLGMDELVLKMKLLYEQSRPRTQSVLVAEAGCSIPVVEYIENHSRLPLVKVKPGTRDKVARVRAVQGIIEAGRVWVPANVPWLAGWMDEMAAFPGGRYDDQVDTMSQALSYLDKYAGGGDSFKMKRWGEPERERHYLQFVKPVIKTVWREE